jgi:hypothetical protein
MHVFIIAPENKPGSLAAILEAVAQRGVNVTSGAAAAWGDLGAVAIGTSDGEATRSALEGTGVQFREIQHAEAWLDDRPGTFADAARRLGNAGINIEAAFPIGMKDGKVGVLFGVADATAANAALGELAGAGVAG